MARRDFNNAMRELGPGGKRAYAYSGRAQTREIPALYAEQAAAQRANAFDPGGAAGSGGTPAAFAPGSGSGIGSGAPQGLDPSVYFGPSLPEEEYFREDSGYRPYQADERGGPDARSEDTQDFRGQGPLSDLDKDILSALGQVPGFGLATNITRAADYLGVPGVIGPTNPDSFGLPGTPEFSRNIEAMRAAQEVARARRGQGEGSFGDIGGSAGTDSFDMGPDDDTLGSSYDSDRGGGIGDGGSPGGGSGGFGGQAGEGAGSGNSAGGGRGDSPGYHDGGYVSEDLIPGELRGDVDTFLQEHEQVLTADATDILGPGFAEGVNMMARLHKRRKAQGL